MIYPPETENSRTLRLRNIFLRDEEARRTLGELLLSMGVFDLLPLEGATPEQMAVAIARHNEGIQLLADLGIYRDSNIVNLIDNMAKMPYKEEGDGPVTGQS